MTGRKHLRLDCLSGWLSRIVGVTELRSAAAFSNSILLSLLSFKNPGLGFPPAFPLVSVSKEVSRLYSGMVASKVA